MRGILNRGAPEDPYDYCSEDVVNTDFEYSFYTACVWFGFNLIYAVPQASLFALGCSVSSHNLRLQTFRLRVSNPRTIADFHFNLPFERSSLPGDGPIFPD